MIRTYIKSVLILITINAMLILLAGFFSQWSSNIIISGIVQFSILSIILFTSYFFLQLSGINNSKFKKTIFIFIPSLIMVVLFSKNMIQLNSGKYIEFGFGINMEGFLKLWHMKLMQTGLVISANILMYIKTK